MRGGHKRHPVLETAVFAAALLLAAFIGRELWRRRAPAAPSGESGVTQPLQLSPERPALPSSSSLKRTESAVTAVPPIKLTRVQRRKQKPAVVPAPK